MENRLVDMYRHLDGEIAKEIYKMSSSRMFETELAPPSKDLKKDQSIIFHALLRKTDALPNPSNDPVLSLLKGHFQEFLAGIISSLGTSFAHPSRFIDGQVRALDFISRQDSRPSEERYRIISERIRQLDDYWTGVKEVFEESVKGGSASKVHVRGQGKEQNQAEELIRSCQVLSIVSLQVKDRLDRYYPGIPSEDQDSLRASLGSVASKALGWQKEIRDLMAGRLAGGLVGGLAGGVAGGSTDDSLGQISDPNCNSAAGDGLSEQKRLYRQILDRELGVDLDGLLQWHELEIQRTRDDLLDIGAKVALLKGHGKAGVPRTLSLEEVFSLLHRYAGPWPTVEEMFKHMEEYVAIAKEASREFVTLPEEKCIVSPTPEQTRDSYPWGGYGGGCWRRRPLVGEVFLNETNYRAVTDGWLKMMAIHECYPGHHAQWVRATVDPLPETVKMGSKSIPLLEGTAHRSERLMESIYDDPVFPLFVALRRHHTSVRIKADLLIHWFGCTVEDAVNLYMSELGFDRESARGQVRYQERFPGYMTCYYYGMRRLEELQEEYGYDDKGFTQELFSVGRLSLNSFEKYLTLWQDDKKRFREDFPSIFSN